MEYYPECIVPFGVASHSHRNSFDTENPVGHQGEFDTLEILD